MAGASTHPGTRWASRLLPWFCRDAGPRAEGEGYWLVAEAAKWYGNEEVRDRAFTEASCWMAAWQMCGWWMVSPHAFAQSHLQPRAALCLLRVRRRTALVTHLRASCLVCVAFMQDRARDSLENLLFGLCRFYELVGRYPEFVVVVGYDFKKHRFSTLHRTALRLPEEGFRYEGTPALNSGALKVRAGSWGSRGGNARMAMLPVLTCVGHAESTPPVGLCAPATPVCCRVRRQLWRHLRRTHMAAARSWWRSGSSATPLAWAVTPATGALQWVQFGTVHCLSQQGTPSISGVIDWSACATCLPAAGVLTWRSCCSTAAPKHMMGPCRGMAPHNRLAGCLAPLLA